MAKLTNKYNLPDQIVAAVARGNYTPRPAVYRVTELLRPPQMRAIELRHMDEIVEDVSECIFRLFGSSIHAVLDDKNSFNRLTEERFTVPVEVDGNTVSVTGAPDCYELADGAGRLDDYKVTSVYGILLGDKPEWEAQVNIYSWMLRMHGFPCRAARIIAVLRDWSGAEAARARAKHEETGEEQEYPLAPVAMIEVRMWSDEEVLAFVKKRIAYHMHAEIVEECILRDVYPCTDAEKWTRPTTYAVKKPANKTASRVLKTMVDAEGWRGSQKDPSAYVIEVRKGVNVRCDQYCKSAPWCLQRRRDLVEAAQ